MVTQLVIITFYLQNRWNVISYCLTSLFLYSNNHVFLYGQHFLKIQKTITQIILTDIIITFQRKLNVYRGETKNKKNIRFSSSSRLSASSSLSMNLRGVSDFCCKKQSFILPLRIDRFRENVLDASDATWRSLVAFQAQTSFVHEEIVTSARNVARARPAGKIDSPVAI